MYSVFIPNTSSTGYFRVDCTLLPGGRGCFIKVFNSMGSFIFNDFLILNENFTENDDGRIIVSKMTNHQLTTNGTYRVYVYSLIGNNSTGGTAIAEKLIDVILPPLPIPSNSLSPSYPFMPTVMLSPSLAGSSYSKLLFTILFLIVCRH